MRKYFLLSSTIFTLIFTFSFSFASIDRNLTIGSKGNDVSELQTKLGLSSTGYFGPLTQKAIIKWQASNNLPATGFFGMMSRNIFNKNNNFIDATNTLQTNNISTTSTTTLNIPYNISATNITSTSVDLKWMYDSSFSYFKIFNGIDTYKIFNSINGNISGLLPGTKYTFYISAISNNQESASSSISLITLADNYASTTVIKDTQQVTPYNRCVYQNIVGSYACGDYVQCVDSLGKYVGGTTSIPNGFCSGR